MGSVCFAPLSIIFPAIVWLSDFMWWRKGSFLKQIAWAFHVLVVLIGSFICVAGSYTTIQGIVDAYRLGIIGKCFSFYVLRIFYGRTWMLLDQIQIANEGSPGGAFSCADNSNSS